METLDRIVNSFEGLKDTLYYGFMEVVPGILLVIFCVLVAFLVEFIIRISLRMVRLDNWLERTGFIKVLHMMGVESKGHVLTGKLFFWLTFLILLEAVANVREWNSISGKFNEFLIFIPKLIGAVIIVMIGIFISKFIKKSVNAILVKAGSKAAAILANITFYAMMIITVTIALNQVGINTSIITANVSILLGALLLSFSLAFVFASKDILANILASSYNRSNYYVGQRISVGGLEGEIIKITNISVVIKSSSKIHVIPSRKLTEELVEILG